MIFAENTDLKMPQSVLLEPKNDPRKSEMSEYLDRVRSYVAQSLESLREGQIKALDSAFVPLDQQLDCLESLQEGWDGYYAEVPSMKSLSDARDILKRLHQELIRPQRISASADGGVAFSFRASGERRAQIEILNNGEKFAHLYDLRGNSYTNQWPTSYNEESFRSLLQPIMAYMQP